MMACNSSINHLEIQFDKNVRKKLFNWDELDHESTLIDNTAIFWQILASDGSFVSAQQEKDFGWVRTNGINAGFVSQIKSSNLGGDALKHVQNSPAVFGVRGHTSVLSDRLRQMEHRCSIGTLEHSRADDNDGARCSVKDFGERVAAVGQFREYVD